MTAAVDYNEDLPNADGVYDKPEDQLELQMMTDNTINIDLPDDIIDKPEDKLELKMIADPTDDEVEKEDPMVVDANAEDELDLLIAEQLPTENPHQTEKPTNGEFTIRIVMNVSHTCQALLSVVSEISKSSET